MNKSQTISLISQPCEINSTQGNQLANFESNQRFDDIPNKPNNMDDLKSISVKRPSFPPSIDIEYLVENLLKRKTKNPKMPNEFFIYRAALVKELKANNYKIKMTKLSTLAANSWSQEPPSVKSVYRRLARETERQYLNVRKLEMSNPVKSTSNDNNVTKVSVQKKKSTKKSPSTPNPPISSTSNNNKPINSFENSIDHHNPMITLPGIDDIIHHVTMSPPPSLPLPTTINDVPTVIRSDLGYQPYVWPQYKYDFTLMEDPIFGMRPGYNEDALYLTPSQQDYLDNLSISTFSSENSSPYLSHPPSPLLPLVINSTNTNKLNDHPQESNCFFAPLSPSIYGLGYNMTFEDTLTINDFSHNYPQFYEQTVDNNAFEQQSN